MTTPRDPAKLSPYDCRNDYPKTKAAQRRRQENKFSRRVGKRSVAAELTERDRAIASERARGTDR